MGKIPGSENPEQLVAAVVRGPRGSNANGADFGEGDVAEVKLGDKSQQGKNGSDSYHCAESEHKVGTMAVERLRLP